MQNRKVSSLVGINSGKCSKIFAESKFSALFFACGGRFPFPEPLFIGLQTKTASVLLTGLYKGSLFKTVAMKEAW